MTISMNICIPNRKRNLFLDIQCVCCCHCRCCCYCVFIMKISFHLYKYSFCMLLLLLFRRWSCRYHYKYIEFDIHQQYVQIRPVLKNVLFFVRSLVRFVCLSSFRSFVLSYFVVFFFSNNSISTISVNLFYFIAWFFFITVIVMVIGGCCCFCFIFSLNLFRFY